MNFSHLKNKLAGPIYSIITPLTETENIVELPIKMER